MYNKIQMGIEGNKKKGRYYIMKEIRTEDAVGHILCHDITQIIKDVKKGVLFKKGHIVREEDIPLLLSVGKEHLYVWEKKEGIPVSYTHLNIIFTAVPALWPKAGWRTKKNRNAISVRPMDVCVQAG